MIKTAAFALALLPWACAQTQPNFTGVWELRKSASAGNLPDSMKCKIDHQGSVFAGHAECLDSQGK